MAAYRDDLEAAVLRSEALEEELSKLRHERREDVAEFRVKAQEISKDIESEQRRLDELERSMQELSASALGPNSYAKLKTELEERRTHLAELDTAVIELRTGDAQIGPTPPAKRKHPANKRRRGVFLIAGIAVIVLVSGVVGLTTLYFQRVENREIAARRAEALQSLQNADYTDYTDAWLLYDELIDSDPSNPELHAEAARVHAMLALEFGTDNDTKAQMFIQQAERLGADPESLLPPRIMLHIHRGELNAADRALAPLQTNGDEDAVELIYLRGLWFLRQDELHEAQRRFDAALISNLADRRFLLAKARSLETRRPGAALKVLDLMDAQEPPNVGARLLRAKIEIETGRDPLGGDRIASEVLDRLSPLASHGQLGWATLLRARYLTRHTMHERHVPSQPARALDLAREARDRSPVGDPEFAALLARTFLDLDEPALARREVTRALKIVPNSPRFQLILAEALVELQEAGLPQELGCHLGQTEQSDAEDLLKSLPSSPRKSFLLSRLCVLKADFNCAERQFQEASQDEELAPWAALALAQGYLHYGRYQEAINLLAPLCDGPSPLPEVRAKLAEARRMLDPPQEPERRPQGRIKIIPGLPREADSP